MNTGIYIRIGKDNVLLENMEMQERNKWLNELEKEGLIRTVNILCETLRNTKTYYNIPDEEEDE